MSWSEPSPHSSMLGSGRACRRAGPRPDDPRRRTACGARPAQSARPVDGTDRDRHLDCRTPGIVTLSRRARAKPIFVSPWLRRSFAPAPGAFLQSGRPRQSARTGEGRRSLGPIVGKPAALRSHRHRRTRLSPLQPARRPVALPSDQQALRKHLAADHHQSRLRRLAAGVRRRQDDDRHARPADAPLRYRRDRQHELAVQKPLLTPRPHGRSVRARRRNGEKFFRAPRCRPSGRATPSLRGDSAAHSHTVVARPSPAIRHATRGSLLAAKRGRAWKRFDIQGLDRHENIKRTTAASVKPAKVTGDPRRLFARLSRAAGLRRRVAATTLLCAPLALPRDPRPLPCPAGGADATPGSARRRVCRAVKSRHPPIPRIAQ